MERLLIVAVLTAVIHLISTLAYSVRLSGVRTRRLATAISLFNVIFLLASTANTIQAPLLASIIEQVINEVQAQAGVGLPDNQLFGLPAYQERLLLLEQDIRIVLAAASVGTLAGIAVIPTYVRVFIYAILSFEECGSVPRLIGKLILSPRRMFKLSRQVYLPGRNSLGFVREQRTAIPKKFLFFNVIVTGIYTTGVLSAIYAGALFPEFRSTATLLSSVVNGIATILSATVVDPTAAAITDGALRGERSEQDVKRMVLYLSLTRFLGTVLAQFIFLPSAYFIKYVAVLLA
ncbi:MAG: lipid II flippase Amj family protein [Desulfotomaculaceae bacterium]|nr:lipid II flippase Amj family protein [Desulfotomaculaceae bacterium]